MKPIEGKKDWILLRITHTPFIDNAPYLPKRSPGWHAREILQGDVLHELEEELDYLENECTQSKYTRYMVVSNQDPRNKP